MARFVSLLAAFVLPVWLLDSCANRDPAFYLDERSQLFATWASAPLTFEFRDRSNSELRRFRMKDVTEFLMSRSLFLGKSGDNYFILERISGAKRLFDTQEARDRALGDEFEANLSDFREIPWYSRTRANVFFPYNLIFYSAVTMCIFFHCFVRRKRGLEGENAE